MGKQHTVFLQNLEPRTHYYVSCVARHSLATITQADLFTTASAASPLRVRSIESVAPESRLPTFRITFDGSVKLGSDPAIWVACGGLTQRFELSEEMIEGAKHDQLRSVSARRGASSCGARRARWGFVTHVGGAATARRGRVGAAGREADARQRGAIRVHGVDGRDGASADDAAGSGAAGGGKCCWRR